METDKQLTLPPQELRVKWEEEFYENWGGEETWHCPEYEEWDRQKVKQKSLQNFMIDRASRWAANQELKQCFEAIEKSHSHGIQDAEWLLEVRRPAVKNTSEEDMKRIDLLVNPSFYGALELLADDECLTKADIIRKAVSLYARARIEQKQGNSIAFVRE